MYSGGKKAITNPRVPERFGWPDQLKKEGVEMVGERVDEEFGKFGRISDLEGNKLIVGTICR